MGLDGLRGNTRIILKETWNRSLQITGDAEIDLKWHSYNTPWYPRSPWPGHRHAGMMLEEIRELCPSDFRMQIHHKQPIDHSYGRSENAYEYWRGRFHFRNKDDLLLVKLTYQF